MPMPKKQEQTSISGCSFTGVKWEDGPAMETIRDVAKALLNLTEVFAASNVKIDSLLSIYKKEE